MKSCVLSYVDFAYLLQMSRSQHSLYGTSVTPTQLNESEKDPTEEFRCQRSKNVAVTGCVEDQLLLSSVPTLTPPPPHP